MSRRNLVSSNVNPNPNRISEAIARDLTNVPEESSLPRSNPVQNQEQSLQDSVAETIPSLSSATGRTTGITTDGFPEKSLLKLREEWWNSCVAELKMSNPRFDNFNHAAKEKLIRDRFLLSDMRNLSYGSVLPEDVYNLDEAVIDGSLVLQVNKIENLYCRTQDRFQDTPAGKNRCLLLTMTDGVRFIDGVEIKPIRDLQVSAPAGLKVVIHNPEVLSGLLMLVPEGFEVLGGMVENLETARRKSAEEVIEPPKVERMQTGVTPPLASTPTDLKPKNFDEIVKDNSSRLSAEKKVMRCPHMASFIEEWGQKKTSLLEELDQSTTIADWEPKYFDEIVEGNSNKLTPKQEDMSYTYLADLFKLCKGRKKADAGTPTQFKIQGIMCGLSGFNFDENSEYKLIVLFKDGSDISEVRIQHNIVERQIGLTPKEVCKILSSSAGDVMEKIMTKYECMLSSLQGTLIIEMSNDSAIPVAIEVDSSFDKSPVYLKSRVLDKRALRVACGNCGN
ncbi:hypothetical protein MKW92_029428 [Papaver armeniacum]|nr:hypothetical protein MKW92_029428 [Papaver armeniacum]